MEEARGELYVLSGSIYAPEREVGCSWHFLASLLWRLISFQVVESQREIERIFNEIAPPPPPPAGSTTDPQDDTNGTVTNGPGEEGNNEGNGQ